MAKPASPLQVVARYHVSPPPNSVAPTSLPLTFFDIPWLCFSATPAQPLFFYQYPYPTCHFLSSTLPTLTHSLSLALHHFFAFSGTLVLPPDSSTPHILYDQGSNIPLLVAESKGDFFHLSGNHQRPVDDFYPLLPQLPSIAASKTKLEIPLLAAQITIFSNSGICIAFAYHNVVADGRTFNSFIKTWASLFRDPCFSIDRLPFYDRTVIKDTLGLQSTFLNEWSNGKSSQEILAIGSVGSACSMNHLSDSDKVRATFLMCPADMEKLKQWIVARCKAQEKVNGGELFGKNPSYLGFNAGGIGRLEYPVPTSYFGNCIGFARAMAIQGELCGEDGIIVAASVIGNRVRELDEAVLRGAESWIADWKVFYGAESHHVMVAGSPKLDFYETDFGWGRPKKIEEISIDNANAISFTESREVKGGIEIGLALPKAKMEAFTSSFTQGLKSLIQ